MRQLTPNERIIFGLKVKQQRVRLGLSFAELSDYTGISGSYLNEIEKGKKFPKSERLTKLAAGLNTTVEELTSSDLSGGLAPVGQLLRSNFLNELPLDLFAIDLNKVAELVAGAPARVGAFISTLLDLSRSYALREEHFYFAALRAYLELHDNYFEDLEEAADRFCAQFQLPAERPLPPETLAAILRKEYGYKITVNGLDHDPDLIDLRSVYLASEKRLLLSGSLTDMQRGFQYGKEAAFNYLGMKERAATGSVRRATSFEQVLNHSRATYFSDAIHLPLRRIREDMEAFMRLPRWDGQEFLAIMHRYSASPEMFYHRLTNIIPRYFGIPKLFFLRVKQDLRTEAIEIDRELHLNRRHQPHGNSLNEHYCRRWASVGLLQALKNDQDAGSGRDPIVMVQRSRYLDTEDEYLCITLARPGFPAPQSNASVTLGLLINEDVRQRIAWLDDPAINSRVVNNTCERCPLTDCAERAVPPTVIMQRDKRRKVDAAIAALEEI